MRRLIKFCLLLGLLLPGVCASGQQASHDEFVSILGRFGIDLPPTYADYTVFWDVMLGDQKLAGSSYRWKLDAEQVVVSYADGAVNLEASAQTEKFLHAVRDDYVQKAAQGSLAGEKSTTLAGHPGLVFLVQTAEGRSMCWVYLVKNRFYLLSLTLKEADKIEEHVKTLATFRVLSRNDLEPRYRQLVTELTPEPLPPMPEITRPTSDAQDAGLKGNVKQVVTESESYYGSDLFGVRRLEAVDDYDERGNRTKAVIYSGNLPVAVRVYGYSRTDRIFREIRKRPGFLLASDNSLHVTAPLPKRPAPTPKIYTLKYKYDRTGRLSELRMLSEGGDEVEKYSYKPLEKKIEFTIDPTYGLFDTNLRLGRENQPKDVLWLDDNGNIIGETSTYVDGAKIETHMLPGDGGVIRDDHPTYKTEKFKYSYEFDARGNWVKRVKVAVTKAKNGMVETPDSVTYRTITYY